MTGKNPKYSEEFKQTIVNLYHSGKTYSQIHKEYGISSSALTNWIMLFQIPLYMRYCYGLFITLMLPSINSCS